MRGGVAGSKGSLSAWFPRRQRFSHHDAEVLALRPVVEDRGSWACALKHSPFDWNERVALVRKRRGLLKQAATRVVSWLSRATSQRHLLTRHRPTG
jgi:hypothetical protein